MTAAATGAYQSKEKEKEQSRFEHTGTFLRAVDPLCLTGLRVMELYNAPYSLLTSLPHNVPAMLLTKAVWLASASGTPFGQEQ